MEFSGSIAYQGPAAPIGITGAGTRSIETWVFNPAVAGEETLVAWGRRGGPEGSNISFNYGSNGTFGAVGHWGAPDMGWNGTPAANEWHHLAYTYDGTAVRVYQDGLLKNIRNLTLNTHGLGAGAGSSTNPYTITVGAQNVDPVPNLEPGLRLSGAMTFVRVHDGVLSSADVQNNFMEDADAFGVTPPPPPPPPLTPEIMPRGPKHRYSFNGNADDSIGGAHGTVINPSGLDASFTTVPGQLDLRANNKRDERSYQLESGFLAADNTRGVCRSTQRDHFGARRRGARTGDVRGLDQCRDQPHLGTDFRFWKIERG